MDQITYTKIFRFWIPLAATWLMMSIEGPFLAAVIARLADPKHNLAAYGVAFSLALIVEAPVIMILSASLALVAGKQSYFKLKRFIFFLNGSVTFIMAVCLLPPVFFFFTEGLINLPHDIARVTYIACLILLPWPSAIGYRRFFQGILIRHNLARRVAYGTVIRLASMSITAMVLANIDIEGAIVGAASLTMGVVCEAVASRVMAHKCVKEISTYTEPNQPNITYRFILNFYYPLALTTILTLGVHPVVTFFIGKSRFAIESLAVLPVVNSLVFIFRGIGLSYQEVGVALLGERYEAYTPLRNFALFLFSAMVICLGLIAFTPLVTFWYRYVAGLSLELGQFSYLPTQIMVLLPGLTVWISFQRSILICGKKTGPITWATLVEVMLIVVVLFASISYFNAIGVVATALAYMIGRFGANLYLISPCSQMLKRLRSE
jgi:hypothetical protein